MAASLVSPVMVGRQAESEQLDRALECVLGGEPATVLVGGEAGVGKSRLINELVVRARAAGARALLGGCVELDGGGIPFAPLVEMLRALAVELDSDRLEALLGPARADIGRLVPELVVEGGVQEPTDRDPTRILELLLGAIRRLASDTPLLLVFEDVQWALTLGEEVLARAYGLVLPASLGGIVLGSLIAGPLVALLGFTGTLVAVALVVLLVCGFLMRRPLVLATSPAHA